MAVLSLIFATSNPHKLSEVQAMLPNGITLRSLADIGMTEEIPETSNTLEGNALQKARHVFERYGQPCFADDTGLEVEALGGAPGVHSARYAGVSGSQQEKAQANVSKLLATLAEQTNRKARFRTVIAFVDAEGHEQLFDGAVEGVIIDQAHGCEGFGYDPIFRPDGYKETFAQMPLELKNRISHRARAFAKFKDFLVFLEHNIVDSKK